MSGVARSRRRPPAALVAILVVVGIVGATWALVTPALQAPDETTHFAYSQVISELGKLPNDPDAPKFSTELQQANGRTNTEPVIRFTFADPEWSEAREQAYLRAQSDFRRDDTGGITPASSYPPLYYAYEAAAYSAVKSSDFFTRLTVMRLASVLFLLINAAAAWLLAGEVFRSRAAQVVTAATVGLWPMVTFITASVNPDAALFAFSTVVLWLGVRILRRGLTWKSGLGLGAGLAAALLVKGQAFALVPTVLLLLAWAGWQAGRRRGWGTAIVAVAATVAAVIVPTVAWRLLSPGGTGYSEVTAGGEGTTPFILREFVSYLWQFYLPRLDSMTPVVHQIDVISSLPLYNLWIGSGWGAFGWVNVWFPTWVYAIYATVTAVMALLAVVAAVRWVLRRSSATPGDFAIFAFLGLTVAASLAGIHLTDYRYYRSDTLGLFAQGRYLLPLAPIFAVTAVWGLRALPGRVRLVGHGAWLGGLLAIQFASLSLMIGRFYA